MAKAKKESGNSQGSGVKEVAARTPKTGRELTVQYNFGRNLEEMRQLFGDAVVYSNAESQMTINLQAIMRRHMVDQVSSKTGEVIAKAKNDDEILGVINEWKPGLAQRVKKSPKEKLGDLLKGMSAEERARLLEEARAELGG